MNSSFKLVDQQSMYNIIATHNGFVDALSKSGVKNLVKNPHLDSFMRNAGALIKPYWEASFNLLDDGTSPYVEYAFGANDWLHQDVINVLRPGHIYTAVITLATTAPMEAIVRGTSGNIWSYSSNSVDATAPGAVSIPESEIDQISGKRIEQSIVLYFATNDAGLSGNAYIELRGDGTNAANVKIQTVSLSEGTFGWHETYPDSLFLANIRYNAIEGYWEVTENAQDWFRLMIDNADFETRFNEIGAVNFYNKVQSDARFIAKSGGTATGKIYFQNGAEISQQLKLVSNAALVMEGNLIQANVDQTGTNPPTKDFLFEVRRGDGIAEANRTAALRWNESLDRWEYNNADGKFRPMGSGVGLGGGGTADAEAEYYAEILENSGFKYGFYDLFDGSLNNTANPGLELDTLGTKWYPKDGTNSTFPLDLITDNVWDIDHTGVDTFFITWLTNLQDNTGIVAYYNLESAGVDATDWIPIAQNEIIGTDGTEISQLFLKFEMTEPCDFHSYGIFYGVWDYHFSSVVRLRETLVETINASAPQVITIPNGGQYTADGKSLEVYHNRVRLVRGIDYTENAGGRTITLLKDKAQGDIFEFYEQFGYADFSAENALALQAHMDDTSVHGLDETTNAMLIAHVNDTTSNPHNVDTTSHPNQVTGAHAATAISANPTNISNSSSTTVQGVLEDLDDAIIIASGSAVLLGQVSTGTFTNSDLFNVTYNVPSAGIYTVLCKISLQKTNYNTVQTATLYINGTNRDVSRWVSAYGDGATYRVNGLLVYTLSLAAGNNTFRVGVTSDAGSLTANSANECKLILM